jgi:hypothetical protein
MKLSTLSLVLGLLVAAPSLFGMFQPRAFAAAARRFPRFTPAGFVLVLAATAWFLYYVHLESVSDFASFKTALYVLFGAVGIGACVFVRDFLPVRGLAVLLLLTAKLMVDTARWYDTAWRLVIVTWAYAWVFAGMWFTLSPWRLRDLIDWATRDPRRTRLVNGLRLGFAALVLGLALTVYSAEEKRPAPALEPLSTNQTARAPG